MKKCSDPRNYFRTIGNSLAFPTILHSGGGDAKRFKKKEKKGWIIKRDNTLFRKEMQK